MVHLASTLLDVVNIGVVHALAASGKESLLFHRIAIIFQGSFLFLFDGFKDLLAGVVRGDQGRWLAIPEVFS